jgi:hypothetical protein
MLSPPRPTRRDLLALAFAGQRSVALPGTFLQFWAAHLDWPPERWTHLFDALTAMRVRRLIIQWSACDELDYGSLVDLILERAAQAGMTVQVGLRYETRWWRDLDAAPHAALARIAEHVREAPRVAGRHAFAGWYLPEEIDDDHWREAGARTELAGTLRAARARLGRLVASGFTNRGLAPAPLGAFWRDLRRGARLDEVLFQDGLGTAKMTAAEWPAYAQALHRALGRRLTVVVETFEQVAGEGPFRAAPAPLRRLLWQCEVARQAGTRSPVAFSLPEYLTPAGGPEAAVRHAEYLRSLP